MSSDQKSDKYPQNGVLLHPNNSKPSKAMKELLDNGHVESSSDLSFKSCQGEMDQSAPFQNGCIPHLESVKGQNNSTNGANESLPSTNGSSTGSDAICSNMERLMLNGTSQTSSTCNISWPENNALKRNSENEVSSWTAENSELVTDQTKCLSSIKTDLNTNSNSSSSSCSNQGTSTSSACLDKDGENLIDPQVGVDISAYEDERDLEGIIALITKDLSEPYSIYTYRYFIHNWPQLCFKARLRSGAGGVFVGAIVCKLDLHRMARRGYIAMLAVHSHYRRHKIGRTLVTHAISAMIAEGCDEVVLETEVTNKAAMRLYEQFGFIRDKRLHRYYLNGVDAFRLKLWIT